MSVPKRLLSKVTSSAPVLVRPERSCEPSFAVELSRGPTREGRWLIEDRSFHLTEDRHRAALSRGLPRSWVAVRSCRLSSCRSGACPSLPGVSLREFRLGWLALAAALEERRAPTRIRSTLLGGARHLGGQARLAAPGHGGRGPVELGWLHLRL